MPFTILAHILWLPKKDVADLYLYQLATIRDAPILISVLVSILIYVAILVLLGISNLLITNIDACA